MASQNWKKQIRPVYRSLEKRELKNAFDFLKDSIQKAGNWQSEETLNELENTYKLMLGYLQEGIKDPAVNNIYRNLQRDIYKLTDMHAVNFLSKNASGLFFEKKRTFNLSHTDNDLIQPLRILEELNGKILLNNLLEDSGKSNFEKERETQEIELFNRIWLSNKFTSEERKEFQRFIADHTCPLSSKCLVVSALMLNLQNIFDENKILMLFDICENTNEEVGQRALISLLIVLQKYDARLDLYPEIQNRLLLLCENKSFVVNIRDIILQFILSKETEKITRKITEELLPEMKKINPILSKKIRLEDLMNESGLDDKNPEWQNIIEETELGDKLKEFSELQMEGADVLHSSFAHLKTYPFFNEISNWFLIFSPTHSTFGNEKPTRLGETIASSHFLCNSDKYSLYLSVKQMPEAYQQMIATQFEAENTALKEMQSGELATNESGKRKHIINQYLHDLYRFFKLFPRKEDFEDIFEFKPEFYQTRIIGGLMADRESLGIIGEYYFNRNYFREAGEIFDKLLLTDPRNDTLYQKKGYCLQMTGNTEDALDAYLKAELINASNTWTLKKIASCYRLLKKPELALEYYRKVEQITPDNLMVQLNIGHCYLELKDYSEALKCYFRVEYLDLKGNRAWRPIAWCSFLTGKYQQAEDYFDKIIAAGKPDASDFLNAGHVQWAGNNIKKAIDFYTRSIKTGSVSQFTEAFRNDIPDLLRAGVNPEEIPLILDKVKYNAA
jgi:Tfp pilus assembly protein PilF